MSFERLGVIGYGLENLLERLEVRDFLKIIVFRIWEIVFRLRG